MMSTYRSCVLCLLLCLVYTVQSVKIRGTIEDNLGLSRNVDESEYINGDKWENTKYIDLNRLVDGDTLPMLTLTNFKNLNGLSIINISLEHIPVFENVSTYHLEITGTNIKSIPTDAFNGVGSRVINLRKNEIQSMSNRSINVDVRELYLRCNKLSNFSQTWFKDPSNIHKLDLSGNQITSVQHQAFNQMTKLSVLELSYNHITSIGSEAFSSGIIDLQLQFNNITQLTSDMFARRDIPISSLFLHHNQLSFLPEALLLTLKSAQISLDGNPWQCLCLRDIERWIREQNIERRYLRDRWDEPTCVVPLTLQKMCVPTVDNELQQTYAQGLSSLPGCLTAPCFPCLGLD